ncbi:MAG: glycosyltransferase [Firmicutes bacterium]|nr:glycosyltransferase [Bacillota bacterium]
MKILLHSDKMKEIEKSGVGRAIVHQQEALKLNHVDYTLNPKEDYDIVHINTIFPESYLMGKRAKRKGKKVIFHAHSTEEDFRNSFILSNQVSPLFKTWLKTCYSSADYIITPTPYSKRLLEAYDLGKPIVAISNGIDLKFYQKEEHDREDFRKQFGFSKDDKVIMSVGLYLERKGITDFVEMAKRMPEYKFIWFGYTNLNTVPARVKEAVTTKLDNLFFPGYISREELKKAYFGSDLFLFMTHEETEGIVLLEALACKTPTLIRDIPIYEGWFENGKNIYKAMTNDEFEIKIKGILEHQLPDLTEKGYVEAQKRDIKEIGKELKEVYETVMELDTVENK